MKDRATKAGISAGKWIAKQILFTILRIAIGFLIVIALIWSAQYCYRQATQAQTINNGLPYVSYGSQFWQWANYNGNNGLNFAATVTVYNYTGPDKSRETTAGNHYSNISGGSRTRFPIDPTYNIPFRLATAKGYRIRYQLIRNSDARVVHSFEIYGRNSVNNPGTPQLNEAGTFTSTTTSITIGWPTDEKILQYQVQHRLPGTTTWNTIATLDRKLGTSMSYTHTGLNANTVHNYAIRGTYLKGTGGPARFSYTSLADATATTARGESRSYSTEVTDADKTATAEAQDQLSQDDKDKTATVEAEEGATATAETEATATEVSRQATQTHRIRQTQTAEAYLDSLPPDRQTATAEASGGDITINVNEGSNPSRTLAPAITDIFTTNQHQNSDNILIRWTVQANPANYTLRRRTSDYYSSYTMPPFQRRANPYSLKPTYGWSWTGYTSQITTANYPTNGVFSLDTSPHHTEHLVAFIADPTESRMTIIFTGNVAAAFPEAQSTVFGVIHGTIHNQPPFSEANPYLQILDPLKADIEVVPYETGSTLYNPNARAAYSIATWTVPESRFPPADRIAGAPQLLLFYATTRTVFANQTTDTIILDKEYIYSVAANYTDPSYQSPFSTDRRYQALPRINPIPAPVVEPDTRPVISDLGFAQTITDLGIAESETFNLQFWQWLGLTTLLAAAFTIPYLKTKHSNHSTAIALGLFNANLAWIACAPSIGQISIQATVLPLALIGAAGTIVALRRIFI